MASDSWASDACGDLKLPKLSISKKIKPPEFSFPTQLVTFVVGKGKEKETFDVHKEHACRYSPVLDKASNSEFKEGRTQKYEIEETNPDTFRVFVQWLYSQRLTHIHYDDHWELELDDVHIIYYKKGTISAIELWVQAEKLLIPQLQNEVMTLLQLVGRTCRTTCIVPFEGHVNSIYRNTAENSMLRRFVVNLIAWAAPTVACKTGFPSTHLGNLSLSLSSKDPGHLARRVHCSTRPHPSTAQKSDFTTTI